MRRIVTILVFIIIIFSSLSLAGKATLPPTSQLTPHIAFHWARHNGNYTGSVIAISDTIKLDKIRFSLYDVNNMKRESGLLSEYSKNSGLGRYIEFRDLNNNDKLDAGDMFIIPEKQVSEDWGVVLTYEPKGTSLASQTLSNERFSVRGNEYDEGDKKEIDPRLTMLIFELNVCGLLLILVFIYIRKN